MITSLIIILIVTFAALRKSFGIDFSGDDYLAWFDYFQALRKIDYSSWFSLNFFFSHYGFTDTIHGVMYKVFSENATPFYYLSFFARYLTAISIFGCVFIKTKSKIAAVAAGIFFGIGSAGLETTSWVFNISSYIAIAFLNLMLISCFKSRYFFVFVFLWLSIVSAPIRMTWLPLLLISLGFYKIISNFGVKSIKNLFFILFGCGIVFWSILAIGNSIYIGKNWQDRLRSAWNSKAASNPDEKFSNIIKKDNYSPLLNPVKQIGAVLVPSDYVTSGYEIIKFEVKWRIALKLLLFSSLMVFIFWKLTRRKKLTVLFSTGLAILILIYFKFDINSTFGYINSIKLSHVWLQIGVLFLFSTIFLVLANIKKENSAILVYIGLVVVIVSVGFFWSRFPTETQDTFHRYLIVPSAGLALVIGGVIGLAKTNRGRIACCLLVLPLLSMHYGSSYKYLDRLAITRNKTLTQNIRSGLPSIKQYGNVNFLSHPMVYYFYSEKKDVLYHSIMFGFPAMVAIRDNLDYFPFLVYIESWEELESAVLDGLAVKRFNWPAKPVPVENIYAYEVDGGYNLINKTKEVRLILEKEIIKK